MLRSDPYFVRLVAGNGEDQGLVFVHPRLAYHFQEQLQQQGMRFSRIQQAYLKWGADVVRQLNDGKQWCSSYLLQHYTDHIKDAHLPAEEALDNYYLPLLDSGWHQVWHEQEGAYGGFLRDLNRIDAALQDFNHAMSNRGLTGSLRIGEELACSLIRASITSLTANIPPALIINFVKTGLWSQKRALALTEHLPDPGNRFKCFLYLSHLLSGVERRNALRLALVSATRISDEWSRAEALAAVADHLQGEERKNILRQALEAATRISDEERRATALYAILLNWSQPADYDQYRNWIKVAGTLGRDHFLAIIKAIISTIEALGGQKAIVRTAKAIEETAHWWP